MGGKEKTPIDGSFTLLESLMSLIQAELIAIIIAYSHKLGGIEYAI